MKLEHIRPLKCPYTVHLVSGREIAVQQMLSTSFEEVAFFEDECGDTEIVSLALIESITVEKP